MTYHFLRVRRRSRNWRVSICVFFGASAVVSGLKPKQLYAFKLYQYAQRRDRTEKVAPCSDCGIVRMGDASDLQAVYVEDMETVLCWGLGVGGCDLGAGGGDLVKLRQTRLYYIRQNKSRCAKAFALPQLIVEPRRRV